MRKVTPIKTTQINSQDELVSWFDDHFPSLKAERHQKRERDQKFKQRRKAGGEG